MEDENLEQYEPFVPLSPLITTAHVAIFPILDIFTVKVLLLINIVSRGIEPGTFQLCSVRSFN